jgi:hypothetical protein
LSGSISNGGLHGNMPLGSRIGSGDGVLPGQLRGGVLSAAAARMHSLGSAGEQLLLMGWFPVCPDLKVHTKQRVARQFDRVMICHADCAGSGSLPPGLGYDANTRDGGPVGASRSTNDLAALYEAQQHLAAQQAALLQQQRTLAALQTASLAGSSQQVCHIYLGNHASLLAALNLLSSRSAMPADVQQSISWQHEPWRQPKRPRVGQPPAAAAACRRAAASAGPGAAQEDLSCSVMLSGWHN